MRFGKIMRVVLLSGVATTAVAGGAQVTVPGGSF